VVAVDAQVLDAAGAQTRQANVGAAVEPLHVVKVGVQHVAVAEQAEPDGQLDGDRQQREADEEEDADPLLVAHGEDPPRPAARSSSRVSG
jgi:hypothetical protein